MLQQLLTIARNTFTESIRQPIFTVLILLGILANVLAGQVAAYTMEDDDKLLIDMGLSSVAMAAVFLAAFTATAVISSEIENRTALTVVSKPVGRPVFVLGKFFGVAGAIGLAYYVLCLSLVLVLRQGVRTTVRDILDWPVVGFGLLALLGAIALAAWGNYMFRWVFTSTFCLAAAAFGTLATLLVLVIDEHWTLQSPLAEFLANEGRLGQVAVGLVLIFEGIVILTAVAVTASIRMGQVMTLLACIAVALLGMVSNTLNHWTNVQVGLTPYQAANLGTFEGFATVVQAPISFWSMLVYLLAKLVYLSLPNLQFLWPADAITQGNPFSGAHVLTVTVYAALYTAAVLCLAVVLFQKREVG